MFLMQGSLGGRNNRSNRVNRTPKDSKITPFLYRKGNTLRGERWVSVCKALASQSTPKAITRQQKKTHKTNFKSLRITRIFCEIQVTPGIGTYLLELLKFQARLLSQQSTKNETPICDIIINHLVSTDTPFLIKLWSDILS